MATATEEKPTTAQKPEAEAGEQTAAFDKTRYDDPELRITKVDGQGIDKIRIGFAGSVMLDRSNPKDVELFNKLTLGKEVELRVAGSVSKTQTGWTTNREGDLDAVVGERVVKVETVYVLDPGAL
jgi:hypothetical protein